jgi:signal peptidase I
MSGTIWDLPIQPRPSMAASARPPIVAALLSLLLPGLGQLYAGAERKAVLWLAAAVLVQIGVIWGLLPLDRVLLLPRGFWLLAAFAGLVLTLWLWAVVDAFLSARRTRTAPLKRFQRWDVLVAFAVLMIGPPVLLDASRFSPIVIYSGPHGIEMAPTILGAELLLASNNWFAEHAPARGDLVAYADPKVRLLASPGRSIDLPAAALVIDVDLKDWKTASVGRVVGLPGDRIQVRNGWLTLNGVQVPRDELPKDEIRSLGFIRESDSNRLRFYWEHLPGTSRHLILKITHDTWLGDSEEFTVPPGHVFVLNDLRDKANDSRLAGPIPIELLRGRPLYVLWSGNRERIGERIE